MANIARKKPGPVTVLDKDLFGRIRLLVFENKSLKEIANICEIPENTIYGWSSDNYLGLADKIDGWKREGMLRQAEGNLKEFLRMDCVTVKIDKDGTVTKGEDPQLLRIKQDTTKFVAQTLGKNNYTTSTETKSLNVNVDLSIDSSNLDQITELLNNQLKNGNKRTSFSSNG